MYEMSDLHEDLVRHFVETYHFDTNEPHHESRALLRAIYDAGGGHEPFIDVDADLLQGLARLAMSYEAGVTPEATTVDTKGCFETILDALVLTLREAVLADMITVHNGRWFYNDLELPDWFVRYVHASRGTDLF